MATNLGGSNLTRRRVLENNLDVDGSTKLVANRRLLLKTTVQAQIKDGKISQSSCRVKREGSQTNRSTRNRLVSRRSQRHQ